MGWGKSGSILKIKYKTQISFSFCIMPLMTLHQPYAASEYLEWMLELRTAAVGQAKLDPAQGTLLETLESTFNHIAELYQALSHGLFESETTAAAAATTTATGGCSSATDAAAGNVAEDKWARGIRMLFEDSMFTTVRVKWDKGRHH